MRSRVNVAEGGDASSMLIGPDAVSDLDRSMRSTAPPIQAELRAIHEVSIHIEGDKSIEKNWMI